MNIRTLFAAALLLAACGGTDAPQEPRTVVNGKYVNNVVGVSLQVPPSWLILLDQDSGAVDFTARGPMQGGIAPQVTVTFTQQQLLSAPGIVLPIMRSQFKADPAVTDYRDSLYERSGRQVAEIAYTRTFPGAPAMRVVQIYFPNRGKAVYVLYINAASQFDWDADFKSIDASMVIF